MSDVGLEILRAEFAELREQVERTLKPFKDITGVNGIKAIVSESNIVLDAEELMAGDGFGGNALDQQISTGETDPSTPTPSPDPLDPGEEFTPGDANTPGASVSYEERSRGGTTTLIGHSEYGSPSTPPAKYLTQRHDQDFKFFTGSYAALSTGTGTVARSWNQAINTTSIYDAITGTKTVTGTRHYGGDVTSTRIEYSGALPSSDSNHDADLDMSSAPAIGTVAPPFTNPAADACFGMVRTSFDADVLVYTANNSIVDGGGGGYALLTSGGKSWLLTDQDTEANAITRLFNSVSWSSWTAASIPSSTATYTARTTGFSFDYGSSEVKATYSGLPINWPFKVRVRIVQINIATGAPNTAFTYNYNMVSDGSGAATWTVPVIPVTPGYNYRVQSVTHTY